MLSKYIITSFLLLFPLTDAGLAGTIIQTTNGKLTGIPNPYRSTVTTYYGVPYGRTTAGVHRWKAPRAKKSWKGIKKFDSYGFVCPDGFAPNGARITGDFNVSEDCLNANIWTGAQKVTDKLPVYVWLHGAGASGNDAMFDGAELASKELVVIVLNHRINVFGYLAHPDLTRESADGASGNYGYLDIILALQWVQDNVAAFGGDPSQVTLGGQSAGCSQTNVLVASTLTDGLIHGAICESGIRHPNDTYIPDVAENYVSLATAESAGIAYVTSKNVTRISDLRKLNETELLTATGIQPPSTNVMDGYVFSKTYHESLTDGYHNRIPVMTGNNAAESGAETTTNITLAQYKQMANATYGQYGLYEEFLEQYPAVTDAEATSMHNANASDVSVVGDWLFSATWAKTTGTPFYTYFFSHAPPGQPRGSYHEAEIYYAFNNFYANAEVYPWTEADYSLGDTMSSYWVNFIKTGNPNGEGLAPWPASTGDDAQTFHLENSFFNVTPIATAGRVALIETYLAAQTKPW